PRRSEVDGEAAHADPILDRAHSGDVPHDPQDVVSLEERLDLALESHGAAPHRDPDPPSRHERVELEGARDRAFALGVRPRGAPGKADLDVVRQLGAARAAMRRVSRFELLGVAVDGAGERDSSGIDTYANTFETASLQLLDDAPPGLPNVLAARHDQLQR